MYLAALVLTRHPPPPQLDPLHGDIRKQFEAVYAAADPAALAHPTVGLLTKKDLEPPRVTYDAYAYDAVWATAIGLAARDVNSSISVRLVRLHISTDCA